MNARTLLLLVAVLVLGGGLAYLFLGAPGPQPTTEGPLVSDRDLGPRRAPTEADTTPRAAAPARAELVGLSGTWTILPGGPKGEKLPKCDITVKRGGETRTATGQASFSSLEPGEWELVVVAEGLPTWRGQVVVQGGGKPTLTTPRLSNDIRVSGTIVDQRGEPVGGASLWLLPEGKDHPVDGRTSKEVLATTSTADGRFRFEANASGQWRLSVGKPGEKPRFISDRFDLELGRERVARIVVPARARLIVDLPPDEFTGANVVAVLGKREVTQQPDPASTVSDGDVTETDRGGAGRLSPGEAEALRKKREVLESLGPGAEKLGITEVESKQLEDQAIAAQKAAEMLSEENQARMREAEQRMERERSRRARLIEEGWATVRSVRIEPGAVGEVDDLPEERDLRFVLYRGAEGFTITESLLAPVGASVKLTLTPPPPFPANTELPEVPRAAGSRMVVEPIGRDALPVGLVFES